MGLAGATPFYRRKPIPAAALGVIPLQFFLPVVRQERPIWAITLIIPAVCRALATALVLQPMWSMTLSRVSPVLITIPVADCHQPPAIPQIPLELLRALPWIMPSLRERDSITAF